MKKLYTLVLSLLVAYNSFAIATTVDQENFGSTSSGWAVNFQSYTSVAQSFVAGSSANLVQLSFELETGNPSYPILPGTFSLTIREGDGYNGPIVGTEQFFITGTETTGEFFVSFSTPVPLTQGMAYTYIIDEISGTGQIMLNATADNYPLGNIYYQVSTFTPNAYASGDFKFRTFIENTQPSFDALCGTTITGNEVVSVNAVTGATKYYFEISENGNPYALETRNSNTIDFGSITNPKLIPGSTYNFTVKANDSVPRSTVVSSCPITIDAPASTTITQADCGTTFTTWQDTLHAAGVIGATQYLFRISGNGVDFEKLRNSPEIKLMDINFLLQKATTYSVTVSAIANGVKSPAGSTCTFTTPGAPQGSLMNCGTTFTAWNQTLEATPITGASDYQFVLTSTGNPTVTLYSTTSSVKLFKGVRPLIASQSYNVSVATKKNGLWGKGSVANTCSIVTPSFDLARNNSFTAEGVLIEVYPNPAQDGAVYFTAPLHHVNVYNAVGELVFEAASAEYLNVSTFTSGLYIIKSDEGTNQVNVK